MDHNFGEAGQLGIQLFPKPTGHQLDRGIFQSRDIVEVRVVELLHNRSHRSADEGMVIKPSGLGIHLALDRNLNGECVAVDASTLVARWDLGQTLRGFDNEIFGEANLHKRVVIDARATLPSSISHRGEEFVLVMIRRAWQFPQLPTTTRKNNG